MAKVEFIRPVEAVHGKLAKSDVIGFARMSKENANEERVKFTRSYPKRAYEPSAAQSAQNTKFGAIQTMAKTRKLNETQNAADIAAFKAQSQWKTLKQYRYRKCEAEYNLAHPED